MKTVRIATPRSWCYLGKGDQLRFGFFFGVATRVTLAVWTPLLHLAGLAAGISIRWFTVRVTIFLILRLATRIFLVLTVVLLHLARLAARITIRWFTMRVTFLLAAGFFVRFAVRVTFLLIIWLAAGIIIRWFIIRVTLFVFVARNSQFLFGDSNTAFCLAFLYF